MLWATLFGSLRSPERVVVVPCIGEEDCLQQTRSDSALHQLIVCQFHINLLVGGCFFCAHF